MLCWGWTVHIYTWKREAFVQNHGGDINWNEGHYYHCCTEPDASAEQGSRAATVWRGPVLLFISLWNIPIIRYHPVVYVFLPECWWSPGHCGEAYWWIRWDGIFTDANFHLSVCSCAIAAPGVEDVSTVLCPGSWGCLCKKEVCQVNLLKYIYPGVLPIAD